MAAEAQATAEAPTLAEELATAAPVKAAETVAADNAKPEKPEKPEKAKKGKQGKKGKASETAGASADAGPSIVAHPRASRAVARAKGWGGLCGFLLGGYLSLPTATPLDAGLRALAAGVVCYVVAWAGALFAWRRLVIIEIKAREQQLLADTQTGPARRGSADAPAAERVGAGSAS